ncbi:RING-H2 finger protein [Melia azedarach]|uniref:RING-H2 finger protein n=1 Tax=Melia azedarach TaxID=155640 RepID=A0ACC1Z1L0_MELAZ|nr:RING-H2 finger protein [Melia azedarach]
MSNKVWNFATEGVVMAIIISVLLLIFSIGALMCFHFCILSRAFRRGFRNGSRSMSRDEVEKLPCYDYIAKSKGSSPVDECAVCLDNFEKFCISESCFFSLLSIVFIQNYNFLIQIQNKIIPTNIQDNTN